MDSSSKRLISFLQILSFIYLFIFEQYYKQQYKMEKEQEILKDSLKTKLAIFFGYNGENYKGMQYQKQSKVKTVENTVHQTLFKCGFILQSNMAQLKRIQWSRAARTDKKVHALCNAISLKMEISKRYLAEGQNEKMTKYENKQRIQFWKIINELNATLPKDIKIYAMKKVTKKFDVRHDAKNRLYNYILPTFVFQSYEDILEGKEQTNEEIQNILADLKLKIKQYLGTHNFHNFTRRMKETDPRCHRYMINMEVQQVDKQVIQQYCKQNLIQNNRKLRFFIFTLLGQSFIYHQIRKMIGLLVQMKVKKLDISIMKTIFTMEKHMVFLSPGEGLYLNRITFEAYNKKHDIPQKLDLNEQESKRMLQFRKEIQKIILGHELKENIFLNWIKAYYQNKVYQKQQSEEELSEDN